MTHQDTLTKAITMAVANGWRFVGEFEYNETMGTINIVYEGSNVTTCYNLKDIIFNHDFAKALWGEEPRGTFVLGQNYPAWQMYLMAMVIAEDPIEYLKEHLPN